jgi:gliding motility-associated-like protein
MRFFLLFWVLLLQCCFTVKGSNTFWIENKGQYPDSIRFTADINGGSVYLAQNGLLFNFYEPSLLHALENHFSEANTTLNSFLGHSFFVAWRNINSEGVSVQPRLKKTGTHNYFKPNQKAVSAKSFKELYIKNLWQGIDAKLYFSEQNNFKYDFIVQEPESVSKIEWQYVGVESMKLNHENEIELQTSVGKIIDKQPFAYIKSSKKPINTSFKVENNIFGFSVEPSDNEPIVIDPEIIFASYTGANSNNFGFTATYDNQGHFYLGSISFGQGYPTTLGAYQIENLGGHFSVAISKFSANGSDLIYSTFLGGSNAELPCSMVTNELGELYMLGVTASNNFPVHPNAPQTSFNGGTASSFLSPNFSIPGTDYFVVKLNSEGSQLLGSTYLGGNLNEGNALTSNPLLPRYGDPSRSEIILDQNNQVIIAGYTVSNDFPTTENAFQPQPAQTGNNIKGVITKLNGNLTQILASSYFSGNNHTSIHSVAVNSQNQVVIGGSSNSNSLNFNDNNGYQPEISAFTNNPSADPYVAVFTSNLSNKIGGSYFGSPQNDYGYFISIDNEDNIYLLGSTLAEPEILINNIGNGYQLAGGGQFVAKFNSMATDLFFSTRFGVENGQVDINPSAFQVDICGKIHISGWGGSADGNNTNTQNLPVTENALQSSTNGSDFWFALFEPDMQSLSYATFLGGPQSSEHVDGGTSRFDKNGIIYQAICAGCQFNSDFPVTENAFSATNGNACNALALKLKLNSEIVNADFDLPSIICNETEISPLNLAENFTEVLWELSPLGLTSNEVSPTFFIENSGAYTLTLTAYNGNSCNEQSSVSKSFFVLVGDDLELQPINACEGFPVSLGLNFPLPEGATFSWSPNTGLDDPNTPNPSLNEALEEIYTLTISYEDCTANASQSVNTLLANIQLPTLETQFACDNEELSVPLPFTDEMPNIFWYLMQNETQISPAFSTNIANFSVEDSLTLVYGYQNPFCADTNRVKVFNLTKAFNILVEPVCKPEPGLITFEPNFTLPNFSITPPENLDINPLNSSQFNYLVSQPQSVISDINFPNCNLQQLIDLELVEIDTESFTLNANPEVVTINGTSILSVDPIDETQIFWQPDFLVQQPESWTTETLPLNEDTYFTASLTKLDCTFRDSILIRFEPEFCREPFIFLPNAFSPNNDGSNDVLQLFGDNIESASIQIFNRWGQLIFEENRPNFVWDGTFNGKPVDAGVYVYQLSVDCGLGGKFSKSGNITVIR